MIKVKFLIKITSNLISMCHKEPWLVIGIIIVIIEHGLVILNMKLRLFTFIDNNNNNNKSSNDY